MRSGIGQAPGENTTRGPIQHGAQINELPLHRDRGRVHSPDLIQVVNDEISQEVRIDVVYLVAPTGVGLAVEGLDADLLHQRTDVLAPDFSAFELEQVGVFATAAEKQSVGPDLKDLHAKIGPQALEIIFWPACSVASANSTKS